MTTPAHLPVRFLITGGAGFIGSHLADALIARGDAVTVIDDLSTGSFANIEHLATHERFRFAIDSIANETVLDRLAAESDVIVHLAAAVGVDLIIRDPVRVIECNILGTRQVLAVAQRYRRKVLLASSSEIYGKSPGSPFAEDDDRLLGPTTRSRWCYSTSKATGEYLAFAYHRQNGLPVVVMRFFNTVGPRQSGQYGMVVPRLVRQAMEGTPLTVYGDGSQTRCFCDVRDTGRAVLALADCGAAVGAAFNVGSLEEVSILELARRVVTRVRGGDRTAADMIAEGAITLVPFEVAYEEGFEDMMRRVPDTRRISSLTGWRPALSLDDTLDRLIAHFRGEQASRRGG